MIQIKYSSAFTARLTLAVERADAALSLGLAAHRQSRWPGREWPSGRRLIVLRTLFHLWDDEY